MEHQVRNPSVVVGVDGSNAGLQALDWAAAEAKAGNHPLRLVHAYQPATSKAPGLPATTRLLAYENGRRILDAARQRLTTGRFSDLDVTYVLSEGPPPNVLLADITRSRSQELVVGSRRLGWLSTLAYGSTSLACAARSAPPVVVVPRGWKIGQRRNRRVVVGVDPTAHGESALGYAFDHARRHRLEVVAVLCWEAANPYARDASTRAEQLLAGEKAAEERLESALTIWREKYPEVRVRTSALHLPPVTALVEQSRGAELLVVGGRQPGLVRGRVLSWVTRGVLRHSTTPVAVVHG